MYAVMKTSRQGRSRGAVARGANSSCRASLMTAVWKVGVDMGGTFTDVVAVNGRDGDLRTAKVPSRPSDPVASVDAALAAVGLSWAEVCDLVHGTTMATNAIVQGRLAPVALVATEGFGDTIEIGRQNRRELYRLEVPPKLPSLVPAEHRIEARERIDSEGRVLVPLAEAEVERVARDVGRLGVEAAAVVLQHSFVNAEHELRLADRLRAVVRYLAVSHQLNPEPREYERSNSTILNAALMPETAAYVDRLERRAGAGTNLHLFHSAGGMASAAAVRGRPLALALSGPAAGVAAAARVAKELRLDAVIAFDMGGTTTDTCVVLDGTARISGGQRLAGRAIRQLMVAVDSIGAGGGSIARIDGKAIRVGPDSAGAEPGPACYGLGGTAPTVTDANVVLGYLSADRLLGRTVRLDAAKAAAAVGTIAAAFGASPQEAAFGIHRIANASMARALRRVTIEQGVDARDCVLLAFGGAGPIHAVSLAREFGIAKVLVPRLSSAFSALGCLTADLSYAEQHAIHLSSARWDEARLNGVSRGLYERLSRPLLAGGLSEDRLDRRYVALVRYAGQSDTVEVPVDDPIDAARLGADFKLRHDRLYGFATDEEWELEALRLTLAAPRGERIDDRPAAVPGQTPLRIGTVPCWFDIARPVDTPRYDRGSLGVAVDVAGPAIVEDEWSTVVIDPASSARTEAHGHLLIDVGNLP